MPFVICAVLCDITPIVALVSLRQKTWSVTKASSSKVHFSYQGLYFTKSDFYTFCFIMSFKVGFNLIKLSIGKLNSIFSVSFSEPRKLRAFYFIFFLRKWIIFQNVYLFCNQSKHLNFKTCTRNRQMKALKHRPKGDDI